MKERGNGGEDERGKEQGWRGNRDIENEKEKKETKTEKGRRKKRERDNE